MHVALGGSTRSIFGYSLIDEPADVLAARLVAHVGARVGLQVVCLNPYSIDVASDDRAFDDALRAADVRLCDGAGLALAARLLTGIRLQRVTGPDFFDAACDALASAGGGSMLFLGGSDDWNGELLSAVAKRWPTLRSTAFAPPFRPAFDANDVATMRAIVADVSPDLLWIGVGSPKQEKLLAALGRDNYGIGSAVGAVFDFHSGRVARAPSLWRAAGMEWLYRLAREPRRLGARTFRSAPRFLYRAWTLRGSQRP